MDLHARVVAFDPHALPDDRTHQIFLSALAYLSVLSRALGKMNKPLRKIIGYSIAVFFSVCCVCMVISLALYNTDVTLSTPTPAVSLSQPKISTIIVQTSNAAQTQTLISAPFTSTPFIFDTPTVPPSATLAPTWTAIPSQTPFILVTQQITPPADDDVCSCSGDTLNCGNFSTQNSAQACLDYCMSQGTGDIHNLDGDANGLACEGLQ